MKYYKFFFTGIFSFLFCLSLNENLSFLDKIPVNFSLKWKIFLWENFYKKRFEDLSRNISAQILHKLPLEKKIGQIIYSGIQGKEVNPSLQKKMQNLAPGGFILFKANIENREQLKNLIENVQKISLEFHQLPVFFSIDQEGGRIVRIENFVSEFPSAMAIGQTENPFFAWLVGFITGYELSHIGINMIFAPVADINNNPYNPVIHTRSFGSSVELVSKMVSAYVQGMNFSSSLSFLKHFPGHGDTHIDSHFDLPIIEKDIQELKELELVPFVEGIKYNPSGVMIAHLYFPKIDEIPSTISQKIITGLLKEELKFQGLIITDAMEMKAISNLYSIEEAAKKSFLAGADIILLSEQSENTDKIYNSFLKSIKEQELSEQRLNESVQKQIQYKLKAGLFTSEILINHYQIDPEIINKFYKYIKIKNEIANLLYQTIKEKYPELEDQIAYDSIRSLYKDFPLLTKQENLIFVYQNSVYEEFILHPRKFTKNDYYSKIQKTLKKPCILIYELNQIEEISKNKNICDRIIYFFDGNPFQKFQLSENEFIIASFSPTKKSRKALIKKILNDVIPKAKLKLISDKNN